MKTGQQNADHAPHNPRREHAEAQRENRPNREARTTTTTSKDNFDGKRRQQRLGQQQQQEQHKMIFQQHFGQRAVSKRMQTGGTTMHADDNAERTTDRGYLISRLPSQITNHN
ncbi:hypothetical protein [uncultured Bacteroides sp.]|uniref:hypothetical protein n=1 Tax=uncultured Bacteroides sp. TaxID=162156 RepID=UPI0026120B81|nr:hypothetical protein [uncultured Bacteroides sp.]